MHVEIDITAPEVYCYNSKYIFVSWASPEYFIIRGINENKTFIRNSRPIICDAKFLTDTICTDVYVSMDKKHILFCHAYSRIELGAHCVISKFELFGTQS